jgi:hypothetical protein
LSRAAVARRVIGKNLLELDQAEAHKLIQFFDRYTGRGEGLPFEEVDRELAMALDRFDPQKALLDAETRLLCLLAMHRVATLGQAARFLFGLAGDILSRARKIAEPVIEGTLRAGLVARERDVGLKIEGKNVKTDMYCLTERGSDKLHQIAPLTNYCARPGLPRRNRVYHDLCVLEARLDLQSQMHVEYYQPEVLILSRQQKVRNRLKNAGNSLGNSLPWEPGCLSQSTFVARSAV